MVLLYRNPDIGIGIQIIDNVLRDFPRLKQDLNQFLPPRFKLELVIFAILAVRTL